MGYSARQIHNAWYFEWTPYIITTPSVGTRIPLIPIPPNYFLDNIIYLYTRQSAMTAVCSAPHAHFSLGGAIWRSSARDLHGQRLTDCPGHREISHSTKHNHVLMAKTATLWLVCFDQDLFCNPQTSSLRVFLSARDYSYRRSEPSHRMAGQLAQAFMYAVRVGSEDRSCCKSFPGMGGSTKTL